MFEYLMMVPHQFQKYNILVKKNACQYFIEYEQIYMGFISYLKKMSIYINLSLAIQEHGIIFLWFKSFFVP